MATTQQMISAVLKHVEAVPAIDWGERSTFTKAALGAIHQAGEDCGYRTRPTWPGSPKRSWTTWDTFWVDASPQDWLRSIREVPLVAEVEWKCAEDNRLYDFHKLAASAARLKVWVCRTTSKSDFDCLNGLLSDRLFGHGHYLIIGVCPRQEKVFHDLIIRK